MNCIEEGFKADALKLWLEGRERVEVRHKTENGISEIARGVRPLVIMECVMDNFQDIVSENGSVPVGKYAFPFQIDLPKSKLPTSFEQEHDSGTIEYVVEALLENAVSKTEHSSDYIAQEPAVIFGEPLPQDPIPVKSVKPFHLMSAKTRKALKLVRSCKGPIIIGVLLRDTLLDRGEEMKFFMACRNRSAFEVEKINVKLIETISWRVGEHLSKGKETMYEVDFRRFGGTNRDHSERSSINQDTENINYELENYLHPFHFKTPRDAHDSYTGKLILVSHAIHVEFAMSHKNHSKNPTFEIAVRIGPPNLPALDTTKQYRNEKAEDWDETNVTRPVRVMSYTAMLGDDALQSTKPVLDVRKKTQKKNNGEASFENLIREVENYIDDVTLVRRLKTMEAWTPIFNNMTPGEFGRLLKATDATFDEVHIAVEVAEAITNFSLGHLLQALYQVTDWNRVSLLQEVFPYASDVNKESLARFREELRHGEDRVVRDLVHARRTI